MKYILLAFVILTVFVGMQHAAAQNTGNSAENYDFGGKVMIPSFTRYCIAEINSSSLVYP